MIDHRPAEERLIAGICELLEKPRDSQGAPVHPPAYWNPETPDYRFYQAFRDLLGREVANHPSVTRLLGAMNQIEQTSQRATNEVLALTARIGMLESKYGLLVNENTRFMKACVCVKLAQEPNQSAQG